ncbi:MULTISPECIES: ribonuclease H1 domain-containing protein [Marinilactibacillus]|uniref:Ribonuclease H n=1 Tax=Marinilactibacillus psychrotolerans TaxID=191770 RepID=A0AAV3WYT0_9LACT|nr:MULTISPECIES: ribonuclease H family protein [Marinilactibacillus]API88962.1 ribonuclease [Marinilactibacillus sp. 15R]GEL68123.1 RNase H [Marinilactibacillus psychrotolerans]GEQ36837.1 ribonuclease HI [Marinilactibacillus psychrotolerans]SDD37215.1 ribonuclease HI [Marinilactibacillus psychrotolerans]
MAKKYYAIKKGKNPGIYTSWAEAQQQVSGFSGAEFKSFSSKNEAENYLSPSKQAIEVSDEDTVTAYVDGSFDKLNNRYSYGVVMLKNNTVLATLNNADNDPKYVESFQIAGECFGSLNAVKWAKNNGYKKVVIHYDYLGIEMWATEKWRTNKAVSKDYVAYFKQLSQNIEVEFKKVKAHSGVEFNELADQLAKDALKVR